MSNETEKLLDMISKNKSSDEICKMLNISHKQLFVKLNMLKNAGYETGKIYTTTGRTYYEFRNPFVKDEYTHIVSEKQKNQNIKVVLISDLHLCNKKDNLDYINAVYDYCIKNNISLIFNLGDTFEGLYYDKKDAIYNDPKEQIDYVLSNYPFDPSILNFTILGNHDASFWFEKGLDIKNILEARRGDIVPVGYSHGYVDLANCPITLQHRIERASLNSPCEKGLLLKGHSHKYKTSTTKNGNITVSVPSLSDVPTGNEKAIYPTPGLVEMRLEYNKNCVQNEYFQHFMCYGKNIVRVGETQYFEQIPLIENNPITRKLQLENK